MKKVLSVNNRRFAYLVLSAAALAIAGGAAIGLGIIDADKAAFEKMTAFEKGGYYFDSARPGTYDPALARDFYSRVIRDESERTNDAEVVMAWYQLGRIDFIEGRFDAAIYKFNHVINNLDAGLDSAYYMLGLAHGYKAKFTGIAAEWERSARAFETFLERRPESPWGRTDLAWVYFAEGRYEKMLPVLEEGLAYEPDNPWLLNMHGLALLNLDRPEEALASLEKAEALVDGLSTQDWGRAYPGNDPGTWHIGLASFQEAVAKNRELAQAKAR